MVSTGNWFEGCTTVDDIRRRYHDLAKRWHPDLGGDNDTMAQINAAYDVACGRATRTQERPQWWHTRYTTEDARQTAYSTEDFVNVRIRQVIERLVRMGGLNVELCGTWVWVGGLTKPVKDILKAMGLRWSPNKGKWYYAGTPSHSHRRYTMDEIRSMHGSRVYADGNEDLA